ncbi:hypothetical protein [Bacillus sp. NSP9.1]|uniref:hypothetical protein n=1 Tax=Bacillus sp. NSP9.1 TaxID=1071078 RepID=UPI00040DDC04|nr:hypothetical protein [Bacillus sp. NSP9.1]QHZ45028.1 hypothetical protein M654_001310 [Bacillus sp. NSP9.1]
MLTAAFASLMIFILTGVTSFFLYALLSYFLLMLLATGDPARDAGLGFGYLGLLAISFFLAVMTGFVFAVVYFCKQDFKQ